MTNCVRNKEGQRRRKMFSMKKEGDFFNYISDQVTLLKLIDTDGNVNNFVSITGCWIYYSNYKIAFPLIK